MNSNANLLARLTLSLLLIGSAGCQTHKSVAPVGHGFEEVSHPNHTLIDDPEPPRISLQHRAADGKVTEIWPSLCGAGEVIKGELAFFVGERAYEEPEKVVHPRLFAVTPPGLPLDITDEVLWRWSKTNGKDFAKTLERYTLVTPEAKNGGLELQLEFYSDEKGWPDKSALQLDWAQVANILHAVKTKGVIEKDRRWRTRFIGERF